MKKYINIFTLLALALISGLALTACSEDDLDTNQYGSGVKLNAYGPNPVMRGGQLRFVGSNLDQISQVVIPGVSPITSIEVVKAGTPSEIRITVPKDGPEVGYVTLVSRTDGELRTESELTYTEAIEVSGFSPAAVMPGDVVTIEGDYLNLVHMIEFTSELQVSEQEFLYHDRYKIEVKVPEDARTGKIRLLDIDLSTLEDPTEDVTYNVIETEEALIVGTPTISEFSSPRGKAGAQGTITAKQGETITVTGDHFNLIGSVKFGDEGNIFELSDFTVSEDGKTLSFTLPAEAPDGSINLVCRSEVEVPVGTLVTVAPSSCVAEPSPVKAGQPLTISGQDMDVVTSVEMPNVIDPIAIQVAADKVIVNAVPELAQEGNLTLRMANGKGVEV
ncbi:MAG: polygalacturonase, partial [Prevotella sp.]|nr:polygalacturonase [Prevotella sp.]